MSPFQTKSSRLSLRPLLIAMFAVVIISLGGCNREAEPSRNGTSNHAEKFELRGQANAKLLEVMLSGNQASTPDEYFTNPFKERFYPGGRWEGDFAQADVNSYGGRWVVDAEQDTLVNLCIKVMSMNEKILAKPIRICRTVGADAKTSQIYMQDLFSGGQAVMVVLSPID